MSIVIASKNNRWARRLCDNLEFNPFTGNRQINLIPEFLTNELEEHLEELKPEWVFFLHWGYHIPPEVYNKFKCVTIHTSNLPYGKGGSPIQNQILDGIHFTHVNAIVTTDPMDSGDVYYSRPITLQGSLDDIWLTITDAAESIIVDCIVHNPEPTPQLQPEVEPEVYKRKKDNNLDLAQDLEYIYDQIRMLDGEGYPNTILDIGRFRFEFSRAKMKENEIICDVKITQRCDPPRY